MKKTLIKSLSLLLAVTIIFGTSPIDFLSDINLFSINTNAVPFSGTCGDNITWTLYADGELVISGTGDMYDWNSYNEKYPPWSHSTAIKTVTVESGVTSIGSFAFYGLGGILSTVNLPDTVTKINDYAFYNCTRLTDISLPKYLVQIGDDAFSYCTGLTSITLPEYVKTIGDWAFGDCSSLTSISLPDSLTSIGGWAFSDCSSLTSITIPNSVTDIGEAAFSNCVKLTSVTLSDSVTIILRDTFHRCLNLESINIPKSVTSINGLSFFSCSKLKRVTIPRSVTNIAKSAFIYCSNITDVYYEGSEKMWNKITIGDENTGLKNATIHFLGSSNDQPDEPPVDPPDIPAGTVSACVKNVSVYPGKTFEVNVFVNDNPGFVSTLFNISYDTSKLTLISVENGEILPDDSFEKGGKITAMPYTVLWIDATATKDYTADGKLLTLTFKASEKSSAVDTQISITADESSTFNSELKPVSFSVEPGTVSIEKRLTGDVNCDGVLNLKDVILIRRSLSSGWDVTVDSTYADVNGNGHVNLLDSTILTRYLAGWNVALA